MRHETLKMEIAISALEKYHLAVDDKHLSRASWDLWHRLVGKPLRLWTLCKADWFIVHSAVELYQLKVKRCNLSDELLAYIEKKL